VKLERGNVEFPLWRKKVDKSIFEHNGTTIPIWACEMWGLPSLFNDVSSKNDERSRVKVRFQKNEFEGWVTTAKHGRSSPALRLWFEESLSLKLKHEFVMSYMRSLEQGLSSDASSDTEKEIPFWEFLDIEFDKAKREFRFVAYYKQGASFPNLFKRLIGSPSIQKIADELDGKKGGRIYKQEWKPREELEYEIGAKNVLYYLLDTKRKLIYVGEAKELVARLKQGHSSIRNWDYFRYNVLPDSLGNSRLALERMAIRDLASLVPNKKVSSMSIDGFKLVNDRIDK